MAKTTILRVLGEAMKETLEVPKGPVEGTPLKLGLPPRGIVP